MLSKKSVELLENFVSVNMSLNQFWRVLNDFLFDLRETGESPTEEEALTGLQALLHEMDEGLRTRTEVYSYATELLGAKKPISKATSASK